MAMDEALAGAGVLMGHTALLAQKIADGALVAPFGPPRPNGHWLSALMPPGLEHLPILDLLAEA